MCFVGNSGRISSISCERRWCRSDGGGPLIFEVNYYTPLRPSQYRQRCCYLNLLHGSFMSAHPDIHLLALTPF